MVYTFDITCHRSIRGSINRANISRFISSPTKNISPFQKHELTSRISNPRRAAVNVNETRDKFR